MYVMSQKTHVYFHFAFRDVMCGKLFCEQGQDNPNYGRSVQFKNCKATFYSDNESDFGQVDTGSKCGDGKVTILKSEMHDLVDCCQLQQHCNPVRFFNSLMPVSGV